MLLFLLYFYQTNATLEDIRDFFQNLKKVWMVAYTEMQLKWFYHMFL